MAEQDPYEKLRPPMPTPPEEICSCPGTPPIKLMCAITYNPIHCMRCNLEVAPETLGLTADIVENIADWRCMYDALHSLWLDSGEYEQWATNELVNLASPVNLNGRELQSKLNRVRRCYYWWFQDQAAETFHPPMICPLCGGEFQSYPHRGQQVCEKCSIVTVGE